jgi:phosphoglycolate phosphatase-like HAD superfamily hydrolase
VTDRDNPGPLTSWADGPAKQAIIDFVERVTRAGGPDFVPPEDRVAVFDNDGTLWCEKPLPVQADFLLRRVGEMAEADPSLRSRQPWKAVAAKDYQWLGNAITKHYSGDDADLREMAAGLLQAYEGTSVEEFEAAAASFLETARHPVSGSPYPECTYLPMIELLEYLASNGFTNYIASGGGRDFMRTMAEDAYGIPPERVIGSSVALFYDGDRHTILHKQALDIFDDGPEKAVRIWSRLGRRPIFACGNSNGDIEMIDFVARSSPSLGILIFHDDALNEYRYAAGAEHAVDRATREGWPIVSMKNDWRTVFRSQPIAAAAA